MSRLRADMQVGLLLALLVVLLSAPAQSTYGAAVRLKNGNRLEGTVTVTEDGQVTIDIPGLGLLTFSEDEIAAIEESAETPVAETPVAETPVAETSAGLRADALAEAASEAISEMSYRMVGISGSQKESGVSIRQLAGRIVIRGYRLAVDEATRAKHPMLFHDRTAQLTKEEYEEVWLQMLEAVDVWNLQNEPVPKDPSAGLRCEATFKRGQKFAQYVVYAAEKPCWALTPYREIDRVLNNGTQAFGLREREQRDGKPFGAYAFVGRKQPGSSR